MQSQKFLDDMNIGPGPWVAPRSARIYIPYLHSAQDEPINHVRSGGGPWVLVQYRKTT